MNDRWLVTAFSPGASKRPRDHAQQCSRAGREHDLFGAYDVVFGQLLSRKLEASLSG